jgi:membrane-bound lytic murein transglycosylase
LLEVETNLASALKENERLKVQFEGAHRGLIAERDAERATVAQLTQQLKAQAEESNRHSAAMASERSEASVEIKELTTQVATLTERCSTFETALKASKSEDDLKTKQIVQLSAKAWNPALTQPHLKYGPIVHTNNTIYALDFAPQSITPHVHRWRTSTKTQ